MRKLKHTVSAAVMAAAISTVPLAAEAQSVLRLDEVAVGELDPAKATDFADTMLMFNAYDTLLLPAQGTGGLAPHLATDWSVDGNDFTFTLRDDVTFESGNPLTAADVVYSYDRLIALGQGFSHLFRDHVASVEAVDDRTVRFTLNAPYAPFLAALTRLQIVDSQSAIANSLEGDYGDNGDYAQAYLSANSAGTGAYNVIDHNPQELTLLARNDDYFLDIPDGAPDEVRLVYGLEGATVRTLMSRGEHDISSQWLAPEIIRALAERDDMQLFTESGTGGFYIKLNTQRPPLDDVHCRRALAYALDYDSVISLIQITDEVAQGVPANGPLPAGMLGANPDLPVPTRDMDAAMAELQQCAYVPDEFTIEISWVAEVPLEERFALLMQANFQELGFNTEVVRVPWALFTERVTQIDTTPHISQVYVRATTPDPDALIYNMYHSDVAGTWQSTEWLNDPEVDAMLEAGRDTIDQEERARIYRDLGARLVELQPTIYAFDTQSVYVARDAVEAETLMGDGSNSYSLDGANFMFRHMTVE